MSNRVRVLLVGVEPVSLFTLHVLLDAMDCDVTVASDIDAALVLATTSKPDVILSDMTTNGGCNMLAERVRREVGPNAPRIVALCPTPCVEPACSCRGSGFNVILQKPIDFQALSTLMSSIRPD